LSEITEKAHGTLICRININSVDVYASNYGNSLV